ncbi:hypothetical protein LCGC14_2295470, partial [marine sediment metagenome]
MAKENLLTYTEVDPNGRLAQSSSRSVFSALSTNEDAYVIFDKGVNFFNGDFTHDLTIHVTAMDTNTQVPVWMLANNIGFIKTLYEADIFFFIFVRIRDVTGQPRIEVLEVDGSFKYSSSVDVSLDTTYYLRIFRDESTGSFGRISCAIFSDAARTVSVGTAAFNLHTEKRDFRYIYVVNAWNSGIAGTVTGYTEDYELFVSTADLTVTTQAATDVEITTATGKGVMTSLGSSDVTAHGHVLDEVEQGDDPTTTDSGSGEWQQVDNGAISVLGSFDSLFTGLTAGKHYYMRAYAINSQGAVYGGKVEIVTKESGGGRVYPSQAITRVTNLIHRYNRKEGVYTLELALGEVTSDFGLPEWLSRPRASIPDTDKQRDVKEAADSPEITKKIFSTVD